MITRSPKGLEFEIVKIANVLFLYGNLFNLNGLTRERHTSNLGLTLHLNFGPYFNPFETWTSSYGTYP